MWIKKKKRNEKEKLGLFSVFSPSFKFSKLGSGPCLLILIERTEGFGTDGVSLVSRPTAQHIVSVTFHPPSPRLSPD